MLDHLKSRITRIGSVTKKDDTDLRTGRSPTANPSPATRRPDRRGMNAFTVPSTAPPPAYAAADPLAAPAYSGPTLNVTPTPRRARSPSPSPIASTADNPYAFLDSFDTMFLIDDSGSMAGRSWRETGAALSAITPICVAHDSDGIDIMFLNAASQPCFSNVRDVATVHEIFTSVRPGGWTPTGQRLDRILRDYLARYAAAPTTTMPINVIVITDGEPSDDVESPIIAAAKRLDALDAPSWQVGIQFFQVGEEPDARRHLETLDDELAAMGGGCRDIVDTVPFRPGPDGRGSALTAEAIMKVLLGAVNRRLDRRRVS